MAKVNIKSEKITPFGGIYYASKAFYALSLDKVINGTIGVHSSTYNGYCSKTAQRFFWISAAPPFHPHTAILPTRQR